MSQDIDDLLSSVFSSQIDLGEKKPLRVRIRINEKITISPASAQNKDWRKKQLWYQGGKHNECEIYQRDLIEKITKIPCSKSSFRINMERNTLEEKLNPLTQEDGFEWTEDFDGIQTIKGKTLYFNLKMVCNSGGSQTRTLREVYLFIKSQLEYLFEKEDMNLYFVNILDGDESAKRTSNFEYLLKKERYSQIKNNIFCGDLSSFQDWFWKTF